MKTLNTVFLPAFMLALFMLLAVDKTHAQSKQEGIVQSKGRGSQITSTEMSTTSSFSVSNSTNDTLLIVKDDGKVGIGINNPPRKLTVFEESDLVDGFVEVFQVRAKSTGDIIDGFGPIVQFAYEDAGFSDDIAYIIGQRDSADNSAALRFVTRNAGIYQERLILKSSGNVGIGGETDPDALLEISTSAGLADLLMLSSDNANDGDLFVVKNNGNVGIGTTGPGAKLQVGENGDGTVALANSHDTFSDRRYKENIRPMENVLDLTRAIEGVRFNWKKNGKSSIGFIAQDIEEVLPEIVHTDEAGYKSVDYSRVVAVLVEAVKEQQKIIEEQKAEIAATKVRMDETIADFNEVKAQMAEFKSALQKLPPVKAAMANTGRKQVAEKNESFRNAEWRNP